MWLASIARLAVSDVVKSTPSSCHFWKVLPPAVDGAVRLTLVLVLYTRVNCVTPLPWPLLSFGLTVTLTPLAGLEEATVRVRVV